MGRPGVEQGLGQPVTASTDPIDRVVRLAPTWTLFALAASGVLVIGMVVWALTGTVSASVTTPGILDDAGGITVQAAAAGQVDQVPVSVGDMVTQGQVVATLRNGTTLTAPQAGQIVAVSVSPGSRVVAGESVVIVSDLTVAPVVVTKVAPSYLSTVRVGLPVRMEVQGASASRYGYLIGTISDITSTPLTNAQIALRLGVDEQLVASELGDAPGLLAVVRLEKDPSNPTGYAWTVGDGPNIVAQQGVPISVHTILQETTPLGLIFPQFAAPR